MRRFVAVEVPPVVRGPLAASIAPLQERHGELRWTSPEGWHVTLAFLGEVPDHDVDRVVEVVRAALVAASGDPGSVGYGSAGAGSTGHGSVPVALPRSLRLAAPGRFGRSVLWAGVEDDPAGSLASLGDAIQRGLVDAGLPVQLQPVQPHVTLARARRRSLDDAVVRAVAVPGARWTVEAVEVWRASRTADGRPYEVDASLQLPI